MTTDQTPQAAELAPRERIMEVVLDCVAQYGVDGTTIRRVADRLGVTTGMLTYHYANKKELIGATLDTAAKRLRDAVSEKVGGTYGVERLSKTAEMMLSGTPNEVPPVSFWISFWAEATREPDLQKRFAELLERTHSSYRRSVEGAVERGDIRDDLDPSQMADLLHALTYGLRVQAALGGPGMTWERAQELYALLLSLLARPGEKAHE